MSPSATPAARTGATIPASPATMLRRLPPLPGQSISWPTSPARPGMQGTLALDTDRDIDVQVPPEAIPHLWAVPDGDEQAMRARAARFVMAVVEAVAGDRPVNQLTRWTTPEVYDDVAELAATVGLTTDAEVRARTERPRLLSLHVAHPTDDVAEVCGHVRHGSRSRALALRLEQQHGWWVCTALQLG